MLHLYQLLLLLYPSAYRREFAVEMISVFRQAQRDCRSHGFKARIEFSLREIAGLLAGASREQTRVRNGTLKGGPMRSFRFPRWAIVSMVLALLAVLTGIESAVIIATQMWPSRSNVTVSSGYLLSDFVFAVVAMMCFLGLIGFVLRAALGRTGIQRLPVVKTWPARDSGKRS